MTCSTDDAPGHRPRRGLLGRAVRACVPSGTHSPGALDARPKIVVIGTPCADLTLRATLEALPDGADLTVLLRVPTGRGIGIPTGLACAALRAGACLHEWYGPQDRVVPDDATLLGLVPDIASRILIVRGSRAFRRRTIKAARRAGAELQASRVLPRPTRGVPSRSGSRW